MKPRAPAEPLFDAPEVVSSAQGKSLYFKGDQLQSQMRLDRPGELSIDYTRTMMGFLLFNTRPSRIALIGLGGGSLLKFCYYHLESAKLTGIEINPQVLALSTAFEVPEDPQRVALLCGDGADFVRDTLIEHDVVLVDGFDSSGQSPSLCSQAFYNDCYQALAHKGMMVANMNPAHPDHELFMGRIRLAFDNQVFELASQEETNLIVFARKGRGLSLHDMESKPSNLLKEVTRAQLNVEFKRITRALQNHEPD